MKVKKFIFHNKHPLRSFFVIIAIAVVLLSCAHDFRNGSSGDTNFQKEGFIGSDIFQILLIVPPDPHVKGLVARRENSRNKAENNFSDLLGKKIIEYRKTNMLWCKNANEDTLCNQAKELIKHALKAAEFFREDESFVVVVRISRKNIREAFECPKVIEEKSSNERVGGKK